MKKNIFSEEKINIEDEIFVKSYEFLNIVEDIGNENLIKIAHHIPKSEAV